MSDSENESRTQAVGRKRNYLGEYKDSSASQATSRRQSHSSKESGEISSSPEAGDADDGATAAADINSGAHDPSRRVSDASISEEGEVKELDGEEESDSDATSSGSDPSTSSDSDDNESSLPYSSSGSASEKTKISRYSFTMASSSTPTLLHHLNPHDRHVQTFYFKLTDPAAPVYCLTCGIRGHSLAACPSRTCEHCGAYEAHPPSICPSHRKCSRCRQRGHDASACRNVTASRVGTCDVCGRDDGHVEEECPYLWAVAVPTPSMTSENLIPEREVRRGCYSCGSAEHWGDDCPYVRREELNAVTTWSRKYELRFVRYQGREMEDEDDEYEPPPPPPPPPPHGDESDEEDYVPPPPPDDINQHVDDDLLAELEKEIQTPPPLPPLSPRPAMSSHWQMGLFDDGRD